VAQPASRLRLGERSEQEADTQTCFGSVAYAFYGLCGWRIRFSALSANAAKTSPGPFPFCILR
jgi:hypothetical protein